MPEHLTAGSSERVRAASSTPLHSHHSLHSVLITPVPTSLCSSHTGLLALFNVPSSLPSQGFSTCGSLCLKHFSTWPHSSLKSLLSRRHPSLASPTTIGYARHSLLLRTALLSSAFIIIWQFAYCISLLCDSSTTQYKFNPGGRSRSQLSLLCSYCLEQCLAYSRI